MSCFGDGPAANVDLHDKCLKLRHEGHVSTSATIGAELAQNSEQRVWPEVLLVVVCIVSTIPSVYLALTQFVEYDGFWHVFIAQQDNWRNFLWDYQTNDHPLLFYLLLKILVHFGRSVLLYRSISLAAGIGSAYLLGRIARKLSGSPFTAPLTALAFGLSLPAIEIAISVRSYMLCTFFVLLSFYYFLDLLPHEGMEPSRKIRVRFAISTMLAVSSHYFSFFYVAACGLVLAALCLKHRVPWKTCLAHGLTFLPVLALMEYFYQSHLRLNTTNLNHVPDFLYQGGEPKIKFLLRNLLNLFNYTAPWQFTDRRPFEKVAAALAAGAIGITAFARSRARIPLLMTLILLLELAGAGLAGRYPFGGFLRQQFILFPFLVLSAGICFDRLLTWAGPRRVAPVIAAIAAGVVLAVFVSRFEAYPKMHDELATREMTLFRATFPGPQAIFSDQFNLILLFTFYHQWQWRFIQKVPMETPVDEYTVSQNPHSMELFRDKRRWIFDFQDPTLYRDMAEILRRTRVTSLTVFCIHAEPGSRSQASEVAFRTGMEHLAAAEHLQIRKYMPDGVYVYAEFSPISP